ncbi:MAG: transketolase [Chloroflexi bacterium]|nr:transketolase [Chloroflexota bacterium]MQG00096.1 transketolase family protein [SAR202 cluster bacterium]|tara:strand:+ start:2715 stop:3650 length:936 start_codon:yes stop_codon:yes gene_type:complete
MTSASPREIFGATLVELGDERADIVVVGGDLNKSTFANLFGHKFPERFFDLGPAEQNMMSLAAGFASSGKTVFASTFAVFATGRPYDQIRTSISQPHLDVKIVATHAGIMTGEDGVSAQGIEDLSLMCALPGFTVVVPSDGPETVQAVRAAASTYGPFYIRLGRPSIPIIHSDNYKFQIGKAEIVQDGKDATIVACGIMVKAAIDAADSLSREGISCRVLNMATIQPADTEAILSAARDTGAIVTAEEHLKHGGLNSVVSQIASEMHPVPIESVSLNGYAESGKPEELLKKYGLTETNITNSVRKVISRKS